MSFFDRLFPCREQETSEKGEVQTRKKENGPEDYLSLEHFEFRHPIRSMRKHMELVRDGIYKGDKRAWHQFLMVLMVSLAGFCLIFTLCINFCFDLVSIRYQLSDEYLAKVIGQNRKAVFAQEQLFPGEYAIIHVFHSASLHESPTENTDLLLVSCKGGVVFAATVPDDTDVPKEWLGLDSYTVVIDGNGNWSFRQSEDFEERRETMRKAREAQKERNERVIATFPGPDDGQ